MNSTYEFPSVHSCLYRVFKSTWGLWIELTAERLPLSAYGGVTIPVTEGIYLAIEATNLLPEETRYLSLGLRIAAPQILQLAAQDLPIVVNVLGVRFSECDFQSEGLACAIAEWAANEFGFSPPEVDVTFDKKENHYVFHFPV